MRRIGDDIEYLAGALLCVTLVNVPKGKQGNMSSISRPRTHSAQSGFTLVEMAIVVLIGGLLAVAAFNFATPMFERAKITETRNKMKVIEDALAAYAVSNNRIPCPAAASQSTTNPPYGFERFSGNGGSIPVRCGTTAADWVGILPYRTLGLDETMVYDGWGRPFTYAISPSFGRDPKQNNRVHARCRTADWMYEVGVQKRDVKNINPYKARFCCPDTTSYGTGNDLILLDAADNRLVPTARTSADALVDQPFDANMTPNRFPGFTDKVTTTAYVIVSHGGTGGGAYSTVTGARQAMLLPGSFDAENSNDDRTFYVINSRLVAPRAADDITVWGTQDTLFAAQGQSCALP